MAIDSVAKLRAVYRPPRARSGLKVLDHLDVHCRNFLALSPLCVISSSRADGRADASPRSPPGCRRAVTRARARRRPSGLRQQHLQLNPLSTSSSDFKRRRVRAPTDHGAFIADGAEVVPGFFAACIEILRGRNFTTPPA